MQKIGKDGKSQQQRANLRICMSCEWIYRGNSDCPVCGWASYGARFVLGEKAYKYAVTQKPYIERRMKEAESKILGEVEELMKQSRNILDSYV